MEKQETPIEIIIPEYYTYYGDLATCPACSGTNVYGTPRVAMLAKYVCADCGQKWEAPEIQK